MKGRPTRPLGELCRIRTGKKDVNEGNPEGEYPFFTCAAQHTFSDNYSFDTEALLIAGNGDVGKVSYYKGKFEAYQRTYVLSDFTEVLPRFLFYILDGTLKATVSRQKLGNTMPYIKVGMLTDFHLPVPPLDEQERIVRLLDEADELRKLRAQADERTATLIPALFHEMFDDPVHNTRGWPIRRLEEIVTPGRSVTYGIVQAGPNIANGVPYIRTGDIKDGVIKVDGLLRTSPEIATSYRRSEVAAGDIVMSIRATVGTTALVPNELAGANLTQGTARISPGPETETGYLLWFLRSPETQMWIQRQVKGATFREITLGALRMLPVLIPTLSQQKKFAKLAREIQELKEEHRASSRSLHDLFQSMLHRAFSGEL